MKMSEALALLDLLLTGLQKYRSNSIEELHLNNQASLAIFKATWPWVYDTDEGGKGRGLLLGLTKCIDSKSVTPMEFYNFMVILDRFIPEVGNFIAVMLCMQETKPVRFPVPTLALVRPWEPE